MKKNINSDHSLSIFDILEISFKNIVKIILITLGIFLILFLLNNNLNKQTTHYSGSIKIFPNENTYFLNEVNRFSGIRNEKRRVFFTQEEENTNLQNNHSESTIKNTDYLTPTRLVWDFSDVVQKKFLANKNISQVEIKSINHDYFENHLSYLTINFKFSNYNNEKLNQVNNLLDLSIQETKNKMIKFIENLLNELLILYDLENKETLRKLSNLQTLLENKDSQPELPENISNDTIVIVNGERANYQKEFNQLGDYCLNKEDLEILETCSDLLIKSQKDNLIYVENEVNKIKKVLELNAFSPVKFLTEENRIKIRKSVNEKYTYVSLLIVSVFLSLFYVIISELYKENRKKIKKI